MRDYIFVIDEDGVETFMPMDLEVGTEFYGGKKYSPTHYFLRAVTNLHRRCYTMSVKLDYDTEEKLIEILGERKDWKEGKRFIEKYSGRNFDTEKEKLETLGIVFGIIKEE